ncbi:DNA polymerase III subunit beta [Ruminococcaceae bacterium OttesenSCG-928-I18]|nr:DNA polymerase III subunit beta [Ruminococcaceae bacterium OttesenSCG-928-I18]
MKFSCDKKSLADAVGGVSKAVTPSSAVPVLQGILLHADGFSLELTGYDLEMAITTKVEANVKEPGDIVLPAKLLGDMLRSLDGEEVHVESEESLATTIKGGITEYDLMGMSAADFPELPSPGADRAFEIDAAELAAMIGTTIYAVSTDDKKPAQTGELFSITPGELKIVAIDGFRFALSQHPVQTDREIDIVVPAKTAAEIARLMGEEGKNITVDANNRYVVFSNGQYTVMSRLIEDSFLNYKDVVPEGHKTRVLVDVPAFEKSIERCSVIITERLKNPLRVTFDEGIQIRCQTVLGKVSDKIEAEIEGDKVEIGFNYRYLLDALRYSGCDKVVLELSGALSPVKVLPAEGDEFLFLVLPVRFKND